MVKDYNSSMSGIDRSDQMLSYHSSLRKTLRWYKKAGVHILECFLQMPPISTESSPLTEISLTLSASKKMSSNVLLAKEKRKLSWNQLLIFTSLHQSQKERKRRIQPDGVNSVGKTKQRVTLCLWMLRRSPSPLHSSMLPSLSSRHWGSRASRGSCH